MRSELGKLTLDKTLAERNQLNDNIVAAINDAAVHWGIRCLRYGHHHPSLLYDSAKYLSWTA
jgi:regulator of protease activity HflC (stomatin/prohibitin superfamily)